MHTPRIGIIIVNWNGMKDTLACLSSLKTMKGRNDCIVCVVDNASSDESIEQIQKNYPEVVIVKEKTNEGFCKANNDGMKKVLSMGVEYIWLLNNDTTVDPSALMAIKEFDDASVGAVGSKIYFSKGCEYHASRYTKKELGKVIWYAGGVIDWENMYASHRGVDEVDHGQYDTSETTSFITGCSIFVKKEVIEKVGMLDEGYYLYLEDLDWSHRIQMAGYKTMYSPSSIVWHTNAASSGKPGSKLHEYYQSRNRLLFGISYAPLRTKVALLKEAFKWLRGGSVEKKKAVKDYLCGTFGKQYE